MPPRAALAVCLFAWVGWAAPVCADSAQPYPAKPVRVIVPLAPGGGSDIVARTLAAALTDYWQQPLVIDNRPGAGSVVGTAIAARAPNDGYTLLVSSSSIAIAPALRRNPGFDIVNDFESITLIASQPSILAVHPSMAVTSAGDLVSLLKSRPQHYRFGSAGHGTASHLANELFLVAAGVRAQHVPYKSAGLAATALLSGEVQFMVTNMATALPQVKAGRVKALGVTSREPSAFAPDLPTLNANGLHGFEYATWYGMLAPAGTQRAVIARIHESAAELAGRMPVRRKFEVQGLKLEITTPAEFASFLKREVAKWAGVVRTAGLQPE